MADKTEERQPDEVLRERARKWIADQPWDAVRNINWWIKTLAAFAQSIQAEARQEAPTHAPPDWFLAPRAEAHNKLAEAKQQLAEARQHCTHCTCECPECRT